MTISPDGSVANAAPPRLVTQSGTWTFGAPFGDGNWLTLLNGATLESGQARGVKYEVANGGQMYVLNAQGQWYVWSGSDWHTSSGPVVATPAPAPTPTPTPPPPAPTSGLQVGFYGGNGPDGVAALNSRFKKWLGRTPDYALDFIDIGSWGSFESDVQWFPGYWTGVVPNLMVSVPLTVQGTSLDDVAAGKHDSSFLIAAHAIVKAGFPSAIIRLGWEANGGWYAWGNLGANDPTGWASYIAAFRHIVTLFRSVSSKFTFNWCTADYWQQTGDKSVLYPGDAYVDEIGIDIEPTVWGVVHPTTTQDLADLNQGWTLDWLPGFGKAHNKAITFPEFGIGDSSSGFGPGDDGVLAADLMAWSKANGVTRIGFWDFNAGDYNSQFSDGSRPNVAAAFKSGIY